MLIECVKKMYELVTFDCKYSFISKCFTFMHLADAFIQSDLQYIQAIIICFQYVCFLGIEPTTFVLLTQRSTAEPQEHSHCSCYLFLNFEFWFMYIACHTKKKHFRFQLPQKYIYVFLGISFKMLASDFSQRH